MTIHKLRSHKRKRWSAFKLAKVPQKFKDPYKQAEYAYSLIEMEVADGE
jgi:hypothetical protein